MPLVPIQAWQQCRCHEGQPDRCRSSKCDGCVQAGLFLSSLCKQRNCGCTGAQVWFARQYKAYQPNTLLLDNALATMGAGEWQRQPCAIVNSKNHAVLPLEALRPHGLRDLPVVIASIRQVRKRTGQTLSISFVDLAQPSCSCSFCTCS